MQEQDKPKQEVYGDIFDDKKESAEDALTAQLFKDSTLATMDTRQGRRFVAGILAQCGVGKTPFTGIASNTDFNCGQQNIGHWLTDTINEHCPGSYLVMLNEMKEDKDNVSK